MKKKKCLRCGYKWTPRVEGEPKQCPYCKSPKWNKPRAKIQADEIPVSKDLEIEYL